ncbi:putative F-box protein At1g32420 [Lycium barbarum]|uniref:putative F-box protein At1g32420 n=1 Tax=Lycium barbarum TaxID=112863 RepID=UPI00293F001F|nr:putative F-box protein At1g32420 [Lycium barbarum]
MEKKKREIIYDIFSFLPLEIIYDIFSRLPVKSLTCLKCVSKFYRSLVSDPSFLDIHHTHSISRPDKTKFLACSLGGNFSYTVDEKVQHTKASVLHIEELDGINYNRFDYVNGLFCLWSVELHPPVIYNLTTRKVRFLPRLNSDGNEFTHYYYSLGFEPGEKKYKILMITHPEKTPTRCWIFTLGSSESWREIESALSLVLPISISGGVCINGVIYFFGKYNNKVYIVEFNVRTEKFRIISLWKDEKYIPPVKFYNLIELEGKLAAIDHSRRSRTEMDLWILERSERSEEWVKYIIAFPYMFLSTWLMSFVCCSYTPDGEIVLTTNSSYTRNWIFFFDLKKKSWRGIEIPDREKIDIIGVYSHVDSLVSCIYC